MTIISINDEGKIRERILTREDLMLMFTSGAVDRERERCIKELNQNIRF